MPTFPAENANVACKFKEIITFQTDFQSGSTTSISIIGCNIKFSDP